MITDVSSFDEAGAQLIRLDAHFQTDCRARRARLHHVLPSPRMRALKGMWRSVAAGEGEGLDVATLPGAISAAIREVFVPKSVLGAVLFRAAVHCIRSASRLALERECSPRYIGGSSDCWRLAFPTPFPDFWRAFKVRPRSYFGRLSSSSRKSNTDIVRIPSLS